MARMDDDMDMPMKDPPAGSSMSTAPGKGMRMMEMMHSKMSDDDMMMGMGAMGGTNSPAAMAMPSALPGFPGQSHLYHIGSTGFFLDHPQHIALSTQQQQLLARYKQQSLLRQGELQRQIDAEEEKLWQLTGADEPNIGAIDKQVREIERLRAEKRIAFIRAVGEAARVLTDEQRTQLTGMAPADSGSASAPHGKSSKPDSSGHM
jgi:Spy/CpxP family protein refolding chaperone